VAKGAKDFTKKKLKVATKKTHKKHPKKTVVL
jgi:hypothetical protein